MAELIARLGRLRGKQAFAFEQVAVDRRLVSTQ